MSGDGIVLSIRSLGQNKIEEIEADAQRQAADAIEAARKNQEASAARYIETRIDQAKRDATRAEHSAHIANGRRLTEVKAEFLQRVARGAEEKLRSMRGNECYREIFYELCIDALAQFDECAQLHVDPLDEALAASLLDELNEVCPGVSIVADITRLGGVIAQSHDAKIFCDNTFETRLNRENSERSKEIWEVLQQ